MMLVILIIGLLMAIAIPACLRARDTSTANTCMANLRQIQDAKQRWGFENGETGSATPTRGDLSPTYLKYYPECPSDGTYTIGSVDENATCSIGGTHVIE